jgi:hypothetical protein
MNLYKCPYESFNVSNPCDLGRRIITRFLKNVKTPRTPKILAQGHIRLTRLIITMSFAPFLLCIPETYETQTLHKPHTGLMSLTATVLDL